MTKPTAKFRLPPNPFSQGIKSSFKDWQAGSAKGNEALYPMMMAEIEGCEAVATASQTVRKSLPILDSHARA
ncbi:MAG: hypothetical protein EOM23_00830 [Candidatus Moranbacteria bacterium]|nr:hypothetical protein [Candidatus Moranbacteria bacterium]